MSTMLSVRRSGRALFTAAAILAGSSASTAGLAQSTNVGVRGVDAFVALFGKHEGYRVVHAKGILCEGFFTAAPTGASVTRANHMQGTPVPVIVRFSDFAGIPTIASGDPAASPRGMSIKFVLSADASTDIVAHSFDGFPAATGEDFVRFLKAVAASGPDSAAPTPLDALAAEQPAVQRFLDAPKPAPASYATETFFGVNAFSFVNAAGETRFGRYRILPGAGSAHLDPAEAATRAPDYLAEELTERLQRGPVTFRLMLQIAGDGDPVTDATILWPEERPQVELGTLTLRSIMPNSDAAQRSLFFTPLNLLDGIGSSDDPLLSARTRAYAESFRRRAPPE